MLSPGTLAEWLVQLGSHWCVAGMSVSVAGMPFGVAGKSFGVASAATPNDISNYIVIMVLRLMSMKPLSHLNDENETGKEKEKKKEISWN